MLKIKKFMLNIITNKIKNIWKIYFIKYISYFVTSQIFNQQNYNIILNSISQDCENGLYIGMLLWIVYAGYRYVSIKIEEKKIDHEIEISNDNKLINELKNNFKIKEENFMYEISISGFILSSGWILLNKWNNCK